MTEDEAVDCSAFDAEAVLLALGPKLEWEMMGGSEFYFVADVVDDGVKRYLLFAEAVVLWKASFTTIISAAEGIEHEEAPSQFDCVVAAKAACERHYATGSWG